MRIHIYPSSIRLVYSIVLIDSKFLPCLFSLLILLKPDHYRDILLVYDTNLIYHDDDLHQLLIIKNTKIHGYLQA